MKKIICLILVLGVAVMFGCAQEKPEAAAKKIFEHQVAGHEGMELDTSGLVYTLVEQAENSALVEVSGGVNRGNLAALSASGVDIVSVGALTHSAVAVDISMTILNAS